MDELTNEHGPAPVEEISLTTFIANFCFCSGRRSASQPSQTNSHYDPVGPTKTVTTAIQTTTTAATTSWGLIPKLI